VVFAANAGVEKLIFLLLEILGDGKIKFLGQQVFNTLIRSNQFGITSIDSFSYIKSLPFNQPLYQKVLMLLQTERTEEIEDPSTFSKTGFREYLELIRFSDQQKDWYFAIVYDSDALWQDPEILDIIPLKKSDEIDL
jgi:hypothetical protein